MQDELDGFFQHFNQSEFDERVVTKSALSQARKNLSPTAFSALSDDFLNQFYSLDNLKTWMNLRLLAIDGSTARLPDEKELQAYFGGQEHESGFYTLAQISECYDVLNGMTIDMQIAPYAESERELAAQHLKKSGTNDLYLYDRGYPAFWLFALHLTRSLDFCMRVAVDLFPETSEFLSSNVNDKIVEIQPNRLAKNKCKQLDISSNPIKVRLIKVVLSTGEIEILMTSLLDKNEYPHEVFKELYHLRWGIEEDYKKQKSRFEIENFTGISVHAIKQDILAKVFLKNTTTAVVILAQPIVDHKCKDRKYKYKVNFAEATSKMKYFLVKFIKSLHPKKLLQKLVSICGQSFEPVRENRSYVRKHKKSNKRFSMNYKRTR